MGVQIRALGPSNVRLRFLPGLLGAQGETGPAGPPNSLSIGTVAKGDSPSATITGQSPNQTLNLVLPKGDPGPPNSLSIGTVTTVSPNTPASATITGESPNQTLNLSLPRGQDGSGLTDGDKGDVVVSDDGASFRLADSIKRRIITPLMFGAVGDNAADDTAALQAAINYGSAVVDLVGLTYRVDGTINLRSDVTVQNGRLDASRAPNGTRLFSAQGTEAAGVSLTADALEGASTVAVSSAVTFVAEDLVYIQSNAIYDPVSSGTGSVYGEFARIKSISGNTLTFYDALHLDYTTAAAANVRRIEPVKNVTLSKMRAVGNPGATGQMFAEFYRCEDIFIDKVRSYQFEERHIQLRRVYNVSVTRSSCRRSWATGTSYGVAINDGSTNITVEDCRFHDLRHGVAVGGTQGVCRSIKAHLNHCTAMRDAGLDSHPASADVDFSFNTIECVPGAQPGAGIICQGPNLKAHGNIIRNCTGIGIYHQMMCNRTGNSDIVSNEVYGAAGSTIGVAVETATNAGAEMTGVAIRGNKSKGFATVVRVYAIGQSISRIDLDGNQALDGTITGPGVFIRALAGKTIRDGSVRGNITAVSGTATNVLMQGNDAASVTDLIVSSNRTQGGSYGIRGINTDRIVTATNICRGSTVPIDVVGAASVLSTNITA